jgi:hypothetical protein
LGKSAVFTIQHDEDFYLPIWLKYYQQNFDNQDIYVISHNCTNLTESILVEAESKGVNVVRVSTDEIFNHAWLTDLVHFWQRKLLEDYQYVLFTDCDELVVPVGRSLREFIDNAFDMAYRCVGFDVVKDKICRNGDYDKTLLSSVPLTYVYGYHTSVPQVAVDHTLHLYHLHKLDYEQAWKRNLRLAKENWDRDAVSGALSIQNQLVQKDRFDSYFYTNVAIGEPYTDGLKAILDN